jgi:uncharacterized protein
MKITEDLGAKQNLIRGYESGRISINGVAYTRSLIVTPEQVEADWAPERFEGMRPEHFTSVVEWRPEIMLIGTGTTLRFPPVEIRRVFAEAQIGLEIMDTAAACRTYNIITMEGRRVAAALLMID